MPADRKRTSLHGSTSQLTVQNTAVLWQFIKLFHILYDFVHLGCVRFEAVVCSLQASLVHAWLAVTHFLAACLV